MTRRRGSGRLPAGAAGVAERGFQLRVRALTRSRPVTELAISARRAERFPDADPVGLALAAVDLVMSRQGLPDAVTFEEAVEVLSRLSVTADPGRPLADHRALAVHVLDGLLNKAEHQARFAFPVGNWSADAGYRTSVLEFWLLREREDRGSGQLVLHADADAINALVAGLAFDVADEQAAAELVLRRQIERGEFGRAEATAQRNLQLSVQYADQLDVVLSETRRDVRAAAPRWETEVPARLHRARDHLRERLNEEDQILDHLREVIDSPPGAPGRPAFEGTELDRPALLAAAGRASRLLEKCRERHLQLMSRTLAAIDVFLEAQQAQAFRAPGSLRTADLGEEVLRPMLSRSAGDAETVGAAFLRALAPSPRPMVRLGDLAEAMLAPARVAEVELPVEEPAGPGEETAPPLAPEVIEAAGDAVRATGLPARLSALLRTAALLDPEPGGAASVAEVLAAGVLWLYAPDTVSATDAATAHDLFGPTAMAAADGRPLPADLVGGPWYGDDLLVAASEEDLLTALEKEPS